MISNDWFLVMLLYGTYTEREIRFFLIYQLSVVALSFIAVILLELFWSKKGEISMSKNHYENNPEMLENLENPMENLEGTLEEPLEGTLEESVKEDIQEPLDEDMEAEDLSCVEDEDRIFILDENGKSVEVEVEDDVTDD